MICQDYKILQVVTFLIISSLSPAISQSQRSEGIHQADLTTYILEKHGLDHELINGIQYYNQYHRVLNHPFYSVEESRPGTAYLSGKKFNDVRVNYNIYSQHLVLEYQGKLGGIYQIILSPAHTNAFELDGNYFEKISLNGRTPLFYQVITTEALSCYIHWKKQLQATSNDLLNTGFFTDPKRTYYLDFNDEIYSFKNRKTFGLPFSGNSKKEIKKFMRSNKINFRNATPEQIEDLLMYVSSRVQSTSGI